MIRFCWKGIKTVIFIYLGSTCILQTFPLFRQMAVVLHLEVFRFLWNNFLITLTVFYNPNIFFWVPFMKCPEKVASKWLSTTNQYIVYYRKGIIDIKDCAICKFKWISNDMLHISIDVVFWIYHFLLLIVTWIPIILYTGTFIHVLYLFYSKA